MRALALTTRFREGAFEGDACLLVYDEIDLSGAVIGEDVRDVLDRRPNTPRIYVLAPFHSEDVLQAAVVGGTGIQRAGGDLSLVTLQAAADGQLKVVALPQPQSADSEAVAPTAVAFEMQEGWLFDLFDSRRGRVEAPAGVHFGKASGKHSDKFLRVSNVLLSSAACGLVAYLALAKIAPGDIRRIFVDTAPLLSVAFAMQRIAQARGLWTTSPPARSFSSYGGLEQLPTLGSGDLGLISASTSGGLAARLIRDGIKKERLLTLFLLKSAPDTKTDGAVLCDLTFTPGRTFGYPSIVNYEHDRCVFCQKEHLLAELEGDQFLLEKRGVKRLRASSASQTEDARRVLDSLAKQEVFRVSLYTSGTHRTDVAIDTDRILSSDNEVSRAFLRLMMRFAPVPVTYVILVDMSAARFSDLATRAGLAQTLASAQVASDEQLGRLPIVAGGNVLVLVGCLSDHARLRGINAQLRIRAPRGCVAYLAAVTIADSARNLADLRMFLSYGDQGAETFTYRAAVELMLPWHGDHISSWTREIELLQRLGSDAALLGPLEQRLQSLAAASTESAGLFLDGASGPLAIASDFVYLDTRAGIELVTQADAYTVVSNLLATARCENKGIRAVSGASPPIRWSQSVYGQILLAPATLCPSNYRDYNDAVLRAAFLRAAHPAELDYTVDADCSAEVLDVLLAEIDAWFQGKGDALPEFLMSMACGRLRIMRSHIERLRAKMTAAALPPFLKQLADAIP
jgi:hypothetical protein